MNKNSYIKKGGDLSANFTTQQESVEFFRQQLAKAIGFDLDNQTDQIVLERQIEIQHEQLSNQKIRTTIFPKFLGNPKKQDGVQNPLNYEILGGIARRN